MTREMMLKRKVGLLLVMLLTDSVAALPMTPSLLKLDPVADDHSPVHSDDHPSNGPRQIKSVSIENGGIDKGVRLLSTLSDNSAEEGTKPAAQHEDPDEHTLLTDDDPTKMTEQSLLREELATENLQEKVKQIMEDFSVYEDARFTGDLSEQIRRDCGEGVLSAVQDVLVNLGDEEGVLYVLTAVALTQLHRCPAAAVAITSQYLATLDDMDRLHSHTLTGTGGDATVESEDKRDILTTPDHCQFVAECEDRDIPTVRQALSERPSLLTLYDVTASAVFASSQSEVVGNVMVHDLFDDLGVPGLESKVDRKRRDLAAQGFPDTSNTAETDLPHSHRIFKRSSCVDKHEAKAQKVISWIPFIGTLYNLVSASVYAGRRCNDVAKTRAIDAAMDVVMDIATVATMGVGSAAVVGIKTGVKVGAKIGAKAVAKAVAKSAVKKLKKVAMKEVKSLAIGHLNPVKGAFREVKDLAKSVVAVVRAVPTLAKKGTQLAKKAVGKLPKTVRKSIDVPKIPQPPPKAADNIEDLGKAADLKGHPRCKRSPGDCAGNEKLTDDFDKQLVPRQSPELRARHRERGDALMSKYKMDTKTLPKKADGNFYKINKGVDFSGADITNKDIFEGLQEVAFDNVPLFVKQNVGGVPVSYIAGKGWTSTKGQVLIKFHVNGKQQKAVTYTDIANSLDTYAANKAVQTGAEQEEVRKQIAEAMLQSIQEGPNSRVLAGVFNGDKTAQSAAEFVVLTQLAEAVPARIKGFDGYFRGGLRDLKENGHSFASFLEKGGLLTGKGNLAHTKKFTNPKLSSEKRMGKDGLKDTGSDPNFVKGIVKQMSNPSNPAT